MHSLLRSDCNMPQRFSFSSISSCQPSSLANSLVISPCSVINSDETNISIYTAKKIVKLISETFHGVIPLSYWILLDFYFWSAVQLEMLFRFQNWTSSIIPNYCYVGHFHFCVLNVPPKQFDHQFVLWIKNLLRFLVSWFLIQIWLIDFLYFPSSSYFFMCSLQNSHFAPAGYLKQFSKLIFLSCSDVFQMFQMCISIIQINLPSLFSN